MVFSYTLITITTMNSHKLTAMSEVSSEHTVSWRCCCVVHNECHASWWYWVAKVRVTSRDSPLVRQIREESPVFSILDYHCWCCSLFAPPFLINQDLYCFWFSCSSFWGIWQEVLPIGSPFCLSCSLSCRFLVVFSLELHQSFLAPLVFTTIPCLHKMFIHCVWLCYHCITEHLHVASNIILVHLYLLVVIVSWLKHIGFIGGTVRSLLQILQRNCRLQDALRPWKTLTLCITLPLPVKLQRFCEICQCENV